jgi:hypothetical protein
MLSLRECSHCPRLRSVLPLSLVVLGTSLVAVAGGVLASRIHRQRFRVVLGQAAAGAMAGGLPSAVLFEAAQGYQAFFGMLTVLLGLVVGTLLPGVTLAMTGWPEGIRRPWGALLLALGGAFIGAFLGFIASALVASLPIEVRYLTLGLSAGAVGALVALGYQLGSGAPISSNTIGAIPERDPLREVGQIPRPRSSGPLGEGS